MNLCADEAEDRKPRISLKNEQDLGSVETLHAGERKKATPPATFVDVSAVRATFCMKIYVTVKQSNNTQAIQTCTHWTITSGAPCWKSRPTINSSRSLRRLMSWKSPCRPSRKRFHKNTSIRRWKTSPSA